MSEHGAAGRPDPAQGNLTPRLLLSVVAMALLASSAVWLADDMQATALQLASSGGRAQAPDAAPTPEAAPGTRQPASLSGGEPDATHRDTAARDRLTIRAANARGEILTNARIRHLANGRGATWHDLAGRTDSLRAAVLAAVRPATEARNNAATAPAALPLDAAVLPCFVLLAADGYETTLLHLTAGEPDVVVPLQDGAHIEVDAGLLRACSVDSGLLTVWPAVPAADGSWSQQDLVLVPRAPDRWAIAVREALRVTEATRALGDLPSGQPFVASLEDDHRRVRFEPLQVVAPARLDFAWQRIEGCTLVFSAPLPTAGTVVFTPQDRRPDEPMLGGDVALAAGTTSAFVPCAVGRPWFVDGCGTGWQFAAPLVVRASNDDTPHVVELRDATQIVVLATEGGLHPDNVQILFAKGPPERRAFERVTFDPMARGLRIVRDAGGWIVRDLPPTASLHAYLEPCNAFLPLGVAGQSRAVIRRPETRSSFRVPDAERDALRAELQSVPQGDPWAHLDQWLPHPDGGAWHATTGCSLPREQLLTGTVPLPGLAGARYRLRITLPGRERIVPLE
jgi:hypothetical protein